MQQTFKTDIEAIRRRAREKMSQGAVTEGYKANREQVIGVLNEVLATEIVCNLRYRHHYYMAQGIRGEYAASEFLEHANDEQQHADWVAERITQLGGKPNFNPAGIETLIKREACVSQAVETRAHAEYVEGENLVEMIKEDLVAERIAVETYSEIIRWLDNDDPTTRGIMEDILKQEEEHADDMASLLEDFDRAH